MHSFCRPKCATPDSKICPLTQPNYLFLRFKGGLIENDVLSHHDLHAASPGALNSRVTNLGSNTPHRNRMGVYLHWVLPRVYRTGTAAAGSATGAQGARKKAQGFEPDLQSDASDQTAFASPEFRSAPNRWMVIRRLEDSTSTPLDEFQAWVLESDRLRNINDKDFPHGVEVDVAPFINPDSTAGYQMEGQSEEFLGYREDTKTWKENQDDSSEAPRRAKLSLLTSSNNFFADYQPHNSNVFSMLDNFAYPNPDPNHKDQTLYLDKAKASYYLVGWHSSNNTDALDPFNIQNTAVETTKGERLKACLMGLAGPSPPAKNSPEGLWSDAPMTSGSPTRVVCHGAMYNVPWDVDDAPTHVPADDIGKVAPRNVAIGTTTLDALLVYVRSQVEPPLKLNTDPIVPTIAKIEQDLLKIQSLLLKQEDSVDPQLETEDSLHEGHFAKSDGRIHWHLAGTTPPLSPSLRVAEDHDPLPKPDTNTLLDIVNACQTVLDICQRHSITLQWQVFAEWWNFVANPQTALSDAKDPENPTNVTNKVQYIMDRLLALQTRGTADPARIANLTAQREKIRSSMPVLTEKGAAGKLFIHKDPTVFVAGIESASPPNFVSSNMQVRLDNQIITTMSRGSLTWSNLDKFRASLASTLPVDIQSTVNKLIAEWDLLQYPTTPPLVPPKPVADQVFPTFHDVNGLGLRTSLGNFADTQAWFPLFIKWEVTYYHIPFSAWTLEERSSQTGQIMPRYRIRKDVWLQDPKSDCKENHRSVLGRMLLLPQPTHSSAENVKQILYNIPADTLTKDYNLPHQNKKSTVAA